MKIAIVHHSADFDGKFCGEIARHFLATDNKLTFYPWDFADNPIELSLLQAVYDSIIVMDLPLDKPFGWTFKDGWAWKDGKQTMRLDRVDFSRFIWIDHHASAILTHPASIPGYRIDGVAACRLAWQYFTYDKALSAGEIVREFRPDKQDYVDRKVTEPESVRLAGEYDIWDKRDPRAETFQYGLRVIKMDESHWSFLFGWDNGTVNEFVRLGEVAQDYAKLTDASTCRARSFKLRWEGMTFLCINSARFNSQFFEVLDIPETGHVALMGFCWSGNLWNFSLYHAKHRPDLDLSVLAMKYGGGGHKGACGFTCKTLPFTL